MIAARGVPKLPQIPRIRKRGCRDRWRAKYVFRANSPGCVAIPASRRVSAGDALRASDSRDRSSRDRRGHESYPLPQWAITRCEVLVDAVIRDQSKRTPVSSSCFTTSTVHYRRFSDYLPMLTVRFHRRAHFIDELIWREVDHPATSVSLTATFAVANPMAHAWTFLTPRRDPASDD
jgi:hypothetical protein